MNRNKKLINLQLMTDYLNATTSSGMSPEMKTYYDKVLLRDAQPNLIHDQFAQKRNIPAGGGKTIEFRKFGSLAPSTTPLTEGVTPDGDELSVTAITATVAQYGRFVRITDVLKLTTIDNVLVEAVKMLGENAGITLDMITRDAVSAGTNVLFAGGRVSRTNLTTSDKLSVALIKKAATILKQQNTPKINGDYVGIINPSVSYDLMNDPEFVSWHQYARPEELYQGEIGKIAGVRFVESTQAKIWNDDTCPVKSAAVPASGSTPEQPATYYSVYSTLIIGANAYATTAVEGGGLQTIIKQLGSGEDPLNQRATAGWKGIKTAKILNNRYMVRIESLSTFSADEGAN